MEAQRLPADKSAYTRLSGILYCAICLESKSGRKPKGLHCFHSFCRSCLAAWVEEGENKKTVDCPVCRRTTKLPKNGVDGLADDFKVVELEGMLQETSDPLICQGCLSKGQSSLAVVKCVTCDRRLCEDCYQFHVSSEMFDNHEIITELCELHGNNVSHVCTTCFVGLCVDCIFSRIHENHETVKLAEGLKRLEISVEHDMDHLKEIFRKKKAGMELLQGTREAQFNEDLALLRSAGDGMKDEIDTQISAIEKQLRSHYAGALKKKLYAEKYKHTLTSQEIKLYNANKERKHGRLANVSLVKEKLRKKLKKAREMENASVCVPATKTVDLTHFLTGTSSDVLTGELYRKYEMARQNIITGKPRKIWSIRQSGCAGLEVLDDFSALISFYGNDHVLRYDTKGKVLGAYHCAGDGNIVKWITVHDGTLELLCSDNITLVSFDLNTYKREVRKIKDMPDCICSMVFEKKWNSYLFAGESFGEYGVYRCRRDTMMTELCSLSPGFMRIVPYAGSYLIAVSRATQGDVLVYDADGSLLYTLGGAMTDRDLVAPFDVTILDKDTLLVADNGKQCVSKFSLSDGSLLGHVLTENEGIEEPWYIACKYPYIWMASGSTVSLYKWT